MFHIPAQHYSGQNGPAQGSYPLYDVLIQDDLQQIVANKLLEGCDMSLVPESDFVRGSVK